MTKSERLGVFIAIALLAIGSFVALTRQQRNFDDHEKLDAHACALSRHNRALIAEALTRLAADPALLPETRAGLGTEIAEIARIGASLNCDEN